MIFALVNESTLVTNAQCQAIAHAIHTQLRGHVAPAWRTAAPPFMFYANADDVPEGAVRFHLRDTDPEAPDALGYHDEQDDAPYAVIAVKPVLDEGGDILDGELSLASVISHEAIEALGDLNVNLWCDMPSGGETARELCDAVQASTYPIKATYRSKPVTVSNFLLPAWFDGQAKDGPFDHLGELVGPFTRMHGGYMIVRKTGRETELYGTLPKHKARKRRARHVRRGVATS
jgi:hypothetical protein